MAKKLYGSKVIDTPEFDQLMFDHRSAMTVEDLRSKSDIVIELAARDYRIAELEAALYEEHYGNWAWDIPYESHPLLKEQ